ncbi:ATP-binding cassette subfamily B protein [Kitasatospora sp. MAA4]|uniref:ABC transporter ATP-binding protein n=1 Tax=Kitasatospora sp. MAA4 TaxID=3035093 RepID=UPI002476238D|nr:ABC transporter ATP-binding protein [Kitasatospora sp. MAA4]MDH6135602.1 ATP-binding cassette subfamily B protein [Kitasatospora sp. MAA4]
MDTSDRLLLDGLRAAAPRAAVLLAALLVDAVAVLLLPAALAHAVDAVLAGRSSGAAVPFLALLAVAVLAETLAQFADPWCTAGATAALSRRLARHTLALGVPGTRRFNAGDLTGRLISSAPESGSAPAAIVQASTELLVSLGGLVALALINRWLAVVLLLGAPAGTAAVRHFVRRVSRSAGDYQLAQAALLAKLLDAMGGIRTIHAAGTHALEVERVLTPLAELDRAGRVIWQSQRQVQWRTSLLLPALQIAVITVAGYGVSAGRTTPGQLLAAVGYTTLALGFLGSAGSLLGLGRARAGAARIAEVLAAPALLPGSRPLPAGPGELVLHEVTVRHGGRTVLDHVSLTVPAGRTLALVGHSGSGKSTLAALAGRLADPDSGQLLLDGVPLHELRPEELRPAVAYAFARPALLGATVEEALRWTDEPQPSAEQAREAARSAEADGFIRRLPGGYGCALSAAPMSGGEAQRLGIARAIAHGGHLVVLDDATSSLDTATESRVDEALDRALAGCTRLVVAHRPGTAARADLVAWLDGGTLRALAPHRALWQDPDYRALFAPPLDTGGTL